MGWLTFEVMSNVPKKLASKIRPSSLLELLGDTRRIFSTTFWIIFFEKQFSALRSENFFCCAPKTETIALQAAVYSSKVFEVLV